MQQNKLVWFRLDAEGNHVRVPDDQTRYLHAHHGPPSGSELQDQILQREAKLMAQIQAKKQDEPPALPALEKPLRCNNCNAAYWKSATPTAVKLEPGFCADCCRVSSS